MRRLTKFLFIVGVAVLATPALAGCYAETSGYVVGEAPPPPREEVVVYRPGQIWVHGHWRHDGNQYVWHSGYYERERPGHVYLEGRWVKRGHELVWIDGAWRRSG
jgi:WXXGXW repeat (2 copies)